MNRHESGRDEKRREKKSLEDKKDENDLQHQTRNDYEENRRLSEWRDKQCHSSSNYNAHNGYGPNLLYSREQQHPNYTADNAYFMYGQRFLKEINR